MILQGLKYNILSCEILPSILFIFVGPQLPSLDAVLLGSAAVAGHQARLAAPGHSALCNTPPSWFLTEPPDGSLLNPLMAPYLTPSWFLT